METIFQTEGANFNYPEARRDDVVDNYHGTNISDPYRWLEDSNSEEAINFMKAQNSLTDSYLNSSSSVKESIENRLKELREKREYYALYNIVPERHGDKYYFFKNEVLYVQETLESNEPKVLLDAKTFSTDNETRLYSYIRFSEDGSLLACELHEKRSNESRTRIHFLNAITGEKLSDILEEVEYYNIVWHNNLGIFYNRFPQENSIEKNRNIYYHRIGTSQSEDIVVIESPENPSQYIRTEVSDCGQWLFVEATNYTGKDLLYFTKLTEKINGKFNLTQIIDITLDIDNMYIGNDGTKAIFLTNLNAPKRKIIAIDLLNYKKANWTTLVPEEPDKFIRDVTIVDNDKFIIDYVCDKTYALCDTDYILQLHSLKSGKLIKKLDVGIGKISERIRGNRKHYECTFDFSSFLIPTITYRVNVKSFDKLEIYHELKVQNFDSSLYEVFRVFYPSKDGTKIPMTIVMRKGAKLDGSMPALLSVKGGLGILNSPIFRDENVIFTQNFNGILAQAHIRGSDESSDEWRKDGILQNRQNGIDDFQSAAEYLIKNGYTSRGKLIIKGDVDGASVVGACINQKPDLFGAAVIVNGIYDILRFHKFTSDDYLISEFCNSDDRQNFENIIKFSPLHNVKVPTNNEQYPATLILANNLDEYFKPILHSVKFIATLQYEIGKLKQQKNPLMFRNDSKYNFKEGIFETASALLTFIVKSLNLEINF
ncbi:prolyl endopeptidase-like isoform X2 [Leptopilina heterotoma]|nr:prolyl endopeptidase-like isoform X2 [Leptopilina heterotoma]XP_043476161.1 prolyl endopeptidase-like isoform X2 [Leptopilina heterotoma]XP_043476162.1 prolyl endopeptidase-like isoform X2 [Leptopilina heterotoma]XP_043476163.1 prolyl endopeptidase-like isoform X2 [Leptopilina heterotoma]XP_043476164.1 prolyl endopeptidase-like isoform X2 [Leptopilina heterotoma]XP_043476165.1 prolyl endopeptidase-like isoform X2 [Leptopilina heterotoma]